MSTGGRTQELTRDPDFWFEDGNTIVIAQRAAFRVHRSLLVRHSDTFSGLFAVPQPSNSEVIDGCPVVRVSDSGHDFKHLLHVLYDGVEVEFSQLAALARLGHKYQLDHLVADVCRRLAPVFLPNASRSFNPFAWGISETPLIKVTLVDAIEALNLFRLLGREDMIPVALYACCQLAIPTLIRGVKRADGTCEQLGPVDLERCLVTRETLTTCYAWRMLTLFDAGIGETCSTTGPCMRGILSVRQAPGASKQDLCQGTHVLSRFAPMVASMHRDGLICKGCRDMLIGRDQSSRRAVWEQLPMMMHLKVEDWPPFDG